MNCLILPQNSPLSISADNPKMGHIRNVLKTADGDDIFAGTANGKLHVCKIRFRPDGGADFIPQRELPAPKPMPLTLSVAFARPQIAQRLLFEAACFGVENLIFYAAAKGEADYAKSGLYTRGEYGSWLIKGAEQACAANLPKFFTAKSLEEAADIADACSNIKIAPDLYEATESMAGFLCRAHAEGRRISLLLGGERGFANPDRELLRARGYTLVSMGKRVLRTDTAAMAALALCANIPPQMEV